MQNNRNNFTRNATKWWQKTAHFRARNWRTNGKRSTDETTATNPATAPTATPSTTPKSSLAWWDVNRFKLFVPLSQLVYIYVLLPQSSSCSYVQFVVMLCLLNFLLFFCDSLMTTFTTACRWSLCSLLIQNNNLLNFLFHKMWRELVGCWGFYRAKMLPLHIFIYFCLFQINPSVFRIEPFFNRNLYLLTLSFT